MKFLMRFILTIVAITLIQSAIGQDELLIRGLLRDFDTKEKLINSDVTVYKNGRLESSVNTGITGKYELHLELGFLYKIKSFNIILFFNKKFTIGDIGFG